MAWKMGVVLAVMGAVAVGALGEFRGGQPSAAAALLKELPAVNSVEFLGLVAAALTLPWAFVCGLYAYHFRGVEGKRAAVRAQAKDAPKPEHRSDWRAALGRPEGIGGVVGYMTVVLALSVVGPVDLVPPCIQDLNPAPRPLAVALSFLVFDTLMYGIHRVQHNWSWLYGATHCVHHRIRSPTIIVALTGDLRDTSLLILAPLHATLFLVPGSNFASVFVFAALALAHLHCIHSEFVHPWDSALRACGLVSTFDHHVHHCRPKRNLAHFFTAIDKLFGTYTDPRTVPDLAAH